MFRYNHYVPILKGKDGEFEALANLRGDARHRLTPLIEVPRSKKSLAKQLSDIAHNIISAWGVQRSLFMDLFSIQLNERISDGSHPLTYLFQCLRTAIHPVYAIPTTGLERDDAYNKAVAKIISEEQRGVCIRLLDDDIDDARELIDQLNDFISVRLKRC
jgi:hypothetical protein